MGLLPPAWLPGAGKTVKVPQPVHATQTSERLHSSLCHVSLGSGMVFLAGGPPLLVSSPSSSNTYLLINVGQGHNTAAASTDS